MNQDLRELYQDIILDHSKRPRNFGKLAEANRQARGNNPSWYAARVTADLNDATTWPNAPRGMPGGLRGSVGGAFRRGAS